MTLPNDYAITTKLLILALFCVCKFNPTSVTAQCGTNLLINSGFDVPIQPTIGNNIIGSFSFAPWTMTGGGFGFNIIRTNGSFYAGGPDLAKNGTQYIDITNGTGTVYQNFTLLTNSTISFDGYFSSREDGSYTNWTASIQIYSLPSLTLVASSNTKNFTVGDASGAAQEVWHYLNGNTLLPAGNYRYVANIGDYGNFDAASVQIDCILPINLRFFNAKYDNNIVKLQWSANEPLNFSHFEIERYCDNQNFQSIAKILVNETGNYTFLDSFVENEKVYYYRLKMFDIDNSISYSKILSVKTKDAERAYIFTNPVTEILTLKGLNPDGNIKIADFTGKIVLEYQITEQTAEINVSKFPAGIYFCLYSDNISIKTMKFVKE